MNAPSASGKADSEIACHQRSYEHLHDLAAEPLDRGELRLGRVIRHDHGARQAELARGPGHALAHVPGARGDDAAAQLLGVGLEDRVQRAAQLERADRLQVLELQVDGARLLGQLEPDERGAHDPAGEALASGADLLDRDQNGTVVPAPSARARA